MPLTLWLQVLLIGRRLRTTHGRRTTKVVLESLPSLSKQNQMLAHGASRPRVFFGNMTFPAGVQMGFCSPPPPTHPTPPLLVFSRGRFWQSLVVHLTAECLSSQMTRSLFRSLGSYFCILCRRRYLPLVTFCHFCSHLGEARQLSTTAKCRCQE